MPNKTIELEVHQDIWPYPELKAKIGMILVSVRIVLFLRSITGKQVQHNTPYLLPILTRRNLKGLGLVL